EALQPRRRVLAGLDADQHRKIDPDPRWIDERDPARDDASRFELLDPLPARRRREPDALGHLRDRQRRILLQYVQQRAVDFIHRAASLAPGSEGWTGLTVTHCEKEIYRIIKMY